MKLPPFMRRLTAMRDVQRLGQEFDGAVNAGRALANQRHTRERNRNIDKANEMCAAMGLPPIARRPE